MKPLAYLHAGEAPFLAPLIGALSSHGVPVVAAQPGAALADALRGLCPLGFAGAWIEGEALAAQAREVLGQLELEARMAGRADAAVCGFAGPRGLFLAPRALARVFDRQVYPGVRLLWVGDPRPELAPGLRGAREVSIYAPTPAEGEAFLAALPEALRGQVAVRPDEARALASQADLLVYAGGALPLELLFPYHSVLALSPVPRSVYQAVERVLEPEYFHAERLLLFVEETLGLTLPPEAFYEL